MREAREYSECSWGAITVTKCLEWSWSIRDHILVMLTLLALLKLVPATQCCIPLLTSGGAATVMNKESDAMMEKKPCSSTVMLGSILRMLLLRLCFCRCPALAAGEDIRFFFGKREFVLCSLCVHTSANKSEFPSKQTRVQSNCECSLSLLRKLKISLVCGVPGQSQQLYDWFLKKSVNKLMTEGGAVFSR